MSEFIRSSAIAGSALALGVLASGCGGNGFESHEFELPAEEVELLNEVARLGTLGLSAYEAAESTTLPLAPKLDPETNYNADGTIQLDDPILIGGLGFRGAIIATSGEDASRVTYKKRFANLMHASEEEAIFQNPDPDFFGKDASVSPEELRDFFKDPETVVSSIESYENSEAKGECTVELQLEDDDLTIKSKGDCVHHKPYEQPGVAQAVVDNLWLRF